MAPRSSILTLLLAVAIALAPLWGLVHLIGYEDGSSHTHYHTHDGNRHSHQHQHGDEDEGAGVSLGDDHHSTHGHTSDEPLITRLASRRVEVAKYMMPPVMAVLMVSLSGDWPQCRRTKSSPWLRPDRSCQTSQLRSVVLLV